MLKDMFFEDDEDFYSHAREGRDAHRSGSAHKSVHFYSHAREGRDFRGVFDTGSRTSPFLTHTPARGVTLRNFHCILHLMHFYSHAREGRDKQASRSATDDCTFLLTRPRGA